MSSVTATFNNRKSIHELPGTPYLTQTTESKKEEFKKYLEKAGVIDQLTRVLVGLYEEPDKPGNGIEYVKKYLGSPADLDVDKMRIEFEKTKEENIKLKKQLEDTRREVPVALLSCNS